MITSPALSSVHEDQAVRADTSPGDPITFDEVRPDDEVRFATGGTYRTGVVTDKTKSAVHLRITSGVVERGTNCSARIVGRTWDSRSVTLIRLAASQGNAGVPSPGKED
ncbi:hypothetical protein AB0F17_61975 [Nonomuraea sp. NPDC026600]|uniref:hypothetical protein n=1 Tax=Nonomuraea sp. NPDC026600 TaxID=3155363 RepID=UPI0033C32BC3